MNWLAKMKELQAANKLLLETARVENRAFTEDENKLFDENQAGIVNARKMVDAQAATDELEAEFNTPVDNSGAGGNVTIKDQKDEPIFKNFAEQLLAIRTTAETGQIDAKLAKLQNSLGMNEGVGSDGGYAVQTDFAGMMLSTAVKESVILSMTDEYPISGNANSVKWIDIDEDDISDGSVFGGVRVYRTPEAQAVAASKPKIMEKELKLEKLMGLAYVTMELDADSSFTDELLTRAFTTAIRRTLTGEVISGDGVGRALGILNGDGLVTVAKESGQTANTVVWENLSKMYHRALDVKNGNYAWIMHPDAHELLDFMTFPVGTAGVPVYTPANLTGTVDTLRGLPVISSDHCSTLGSKGDVILADMSDYLLATKGGVQKDISIHVQFLTAENAYRFIFRANGRPKMTNDLTIKNSSKKRGKYITLAARG